MRLTNPNSLRALQDIFSMYERKHNFLSKMKPRSTTSFLDEVILTLSIK